MRILWIAGVAALAGCSASWPVNGELGGDPVTGTATAAVSGGSFRVQNARGLVCAGTYDAYSAEITITAPVTCSDGRKGRAVISRKTNLLAGTGIVRLDDGTEGRFVFGDLSFAKEFGS
ncbi:MAG: hypothetical protein QNJ44_22660 [Rhodobacter sp.]|nr:hypothetical protein [Rhodobacter sp.]